MAGPRGHRRPHQVGRWAGHCPHLIQRSCPGNPDQEERHLPPRTWPEGLHYARLRGATQNEGGPCSEDPQAGCPLLSADGSSWQFPVLFLLSAFPSCPCTGHNHLSAQLSVPAAGCKLGASVACVGSLPLHSSSPAFALWPDI